MPRHWSLALALLCAMHLSQCSADGGQVSFNQHIRPILAENCLECHGPDANRREADLRLDVEAAVRANVVPSNNPAESELIARITSTDETLRMPPPDTGKKLSQEQIDLFRRWIEDGAKYEDHWAFMPITAPSVPALSNHSGSLSDIDRFVVDRLLLRDLTLSPPIHKQQWIRRATLDLTGIPPSWGDVEAFLGDHTPQAYEKVIDRLLASPLYGQRWGRHWLDIARYADTHGGSAIGFIAFPFSYTYRDYVIHAFNADLPFDQFVTEQLAADQLGRDPDHPSLAALGFLTIGMQFRNRHDLIDDQIDVVSRGLLGLTVACARCHDHKFDAISTEDYYSLYATFAASESPEELPTIAAASQREAFEEYSQALALAQVQVDDIAREQSEVMRNRLRMQVGMYLTEIAKGVAEQDTSTTFLSYRTDDIRPLVLNRWRDYVSKLPDDDSVFGVWKRLSQFGAEGFAARAAETIDALVKENGAIPNPAESSLLGATTPKWNPRVLDAFAARKPTSLLDAAEIYGDLFAMVQEEWMASQQMAALEAKAGGEIVPDEDQRHQIINGPIHRQLRHHLYGEGTPMALSDKVAATLLNRTVQDHLDGRRAGIHNLHLTSPGSPPRAMTLIESLNPPEFHILRRGNPLDRGAVVQARFLSALSSKPPYAFANGKRRLQLAQAILDQDNPLTRRVIVNWVWQHHFGQGLVRTADDFGIRGTPPTHPELLDYLAESFRSDGWSLKKLHRKIMLSAVYSQGAVEQIKARAEDPENALLWRMPRRRLDFEAMRDSMLAVSGELDTSLDGRPFDLQAQPVIPRRSIYGFVNRDVVSNLTSTFDGSNPNACTAKRPETSVPQQTLFALNSDFIQDRAEKLAAIAENTSISAAERVQWLYRQVYGRSPDEPELSQALDFVSRSAEGGKADDPESNGRFPSIWARLAHALLASNEFTFVD